MKELLKWLQGLGVGAASAAIAYFSANVGAGPEGGDVTLNIVIVAVLTRLAGFLVSLAGPKAPTTPSSTIR